MNWRNLRPCIHHESLEKNGVHDPNTVQGWAWDGTASPKNFCPRDLSPKAQNPGTVQRIFVPVPSVPDLCPIGQLWDYFLKMNPYCTQIKIFE